MATLRLLLLFALLSSTYAHFIPFENCLSPGIVSPSSGEKPLQFVPLFVWAYFNNSSPNRNLNVTVYGNIAGIATQQSYPPEDSSQWTDPNDTIGKIPDLGGTYPDLKYTTFTTSFDVLDYVPYNPPATRLCNTSAISPCPWAPNFNFTGSSSNVAPAFNPSGDGSNSSQLSAMSVAHDLFSSYAFTTINAQLELKSGDVGAQMLACVQANITPDLGSPVANTLQFVPLVILILVAIATAFAAIISPWGSTDVFRFTSNYGRDDDLLRLITPGFGDCLQYIQFIVLAGSLSLNYPGFFQPAVSQVSWSALMFNESFLTHRSGFQAVVDGIYVDNATYGLDRMSQLVGMGDDSDMWAGMIIWLLVIIAAVVALIQIGFAARWLYRLVSGTHQEDLRRKNIPFSAGNAIRIVFNYFLLPLVALSCYQLVIAGSSPKSVVAVAAVVLVLLIAFSGFLVWLIATTRPRSYLFDDLPTVLLYGPLYNTYSDHAATFALCPIILTFVRGIAIGAVQPSGIAQIVLLALCEVVTILTLNAFRPFHSPTSMNAFHTFFAVARLLTVLLSIAFLPSLNVRNAPRGWVGYVILLLHGIVLVFGFFLNATQTLIEILARMAGAGGEDGTATRGGLVRAFGMRQLSRRNPRRGAAAAARARQSTTSTAAMLTAQEDRKSLALNGTRSRSMSGSSAILLSRQAADARQSMTLDSVSASAQGDPPLSGGASAFSYIPTNAHTGVGLVGGAAPHDPYYRPPRPRRTLTDQSSLSPQRKLNRQSWQSGNKRLSQAQYDLEAPPGWEDPAGSHRGTPVPGQLGGIRERADSDAAADGDPRARTDYATREVDFYYGVRGPALSNQPTRRLKTGPADPTGPVSSASGWLKGLFGGKTKEKGKGFEVVRSSRASPRGLVAGRQVSASVAPSEEMDPYTDDPRSTGLTRSRDLDLSDEGDAIGAGTRHLPKEQAQDAPSPMNSDDEGSHHGSVSDDEEDKVWQSRQSEISHLPPTLPDIESTGGIELPSRMGSSKSGPAVSRASTKSIKPTVPRKSSKRDSATDLGRLTSPSRAPAQASATSLLPPADRAHETSSRLPFAPSPQQHKKSASHMSALSSTSYGAAYSTPPRGGIRHVEGAPSDDDDEEDDLMAVSGHDGAGHARNSSGVLGVHDFASYDRPTSMGYVQQHRASDNITTPRGGSAVIAGTSAELVDDGGGVPRSPDPAAEHNGGVGKAM